MLRDGIGRAAVRRVHDESVYAVLAAFSGAGDLHRDRERVVVLSKFGGVDDVFSQEEGRGGGVGGLRHGDGWGGAAAAGAASAAPAGVCMDDPRAGLHYAGVNDVASRLYAFEITAPPDRAVG